jgi:hypothetical protein
VEVRAALAAVPVCCPDAGVDGLTLLTVGAEPARVVLTPGAAAWSEGTFGSDGAFRGTAGGGRYTGVGGGVTWTGGGGVVTWIGVGGGGRWTGSGGGA